MAIISVKIDDQLKAKAEQVSAGIGIPLSSVINIFLRRFVAETGFPFPVKAVDIDAMKPTSFRELLEAHYGTSFDEALSQFQAEGDDTDID